jgi:predicted nuclease of predicted toxin-antitoxin system
MVALYLDADYDPLVARRQRSRGFDVVSAHEVGMSDANDAEHLDYAAHRGRVLLTFNTKDFASLHTQWVADGRPHAGIVVSRQYRRREIGELLRLVENLLLLATDEDLANRLLYLTEFEV